MNRSSHWPRRVSIAALGILLPLLGPPAGFGATPPQDAALAPSRLATLLEAHDVPVSSAEIDTAVSEAMLAAIDPFYSWRGPDHAVSASSFPQAWDWPLGLGYLIAPEIADATVGDIEQTLRQWAQDPCRGIVIDLRGSGGSSAAAVNRLAGHFVPEGTVLYQLVDGRGTVIETHRALRTEATLDDLPPAVLLVDGETRGAAEILAAVLDSRPTIMTCGTASAGDGAIREALPISTNRMLYIATRWARPAGQMLLKHHPLNPGITVSDTNNYVRLFTDIPADALDEKRSYARRNAFQTLATFTHEDAVLSRAADALLAFDILASQATSEPPGEAEADLAVPASPSNPQPEDK